MWRKFELPRDAEGSARREFGGAKEAKESSVAIFFCE
tara:strand:+ start:289 stop:399 length:111 start_codon:yes stop_codon:yes gene_type:complete